MKQRPYILPEGYLQKLNSSLIEIPQADVRRQRSPYLAFALASFAAAVLAIGVFVFRPQPRQEYVSYERMVLADLIPQSEDAFADQVTPDAEDLIQYMINEGYPLEFFVEP